MTFGPDRKEKPFTTSSNPHHTEGVLLAKEIPPREFDNVGDFAITPLRNTDSDLRENNQEKVIVYLKGWRLHVLSAACDEQSKCAMVNDAADVFTGYV